MCWSGQPPRSRTCLAPPPRRSTAGYGGLAPGSRTHCPPKTSSLSPPIRASARYSTGSPRRSRTPTPARSRHGRADQRASAAGVGGSLRAGRRRAGHPALAVVPHPCADWDLEALLDHVSDSAGVLHQAITAGCAGPAPLSDDGPPGLDPVCGLQRQTARLLATCAAAGPAPRLVAIGDR